MAAGRFRRPKYTLTLAFASNATTISTDTPNINGLLSEILIKTPATVDSSATVAVNLIDQDGYTIYTKSGVAANTRSVNVLTADTKAPIGGSVTIQVVFSASQTANRAVEVVLLVDRG